MRSRIDIKSALAPPSWIASPICWVVFGVARRVSSLSASLTGRVGVSLAIDQPTTRWLQTSTTTVR